VPAVPNVKFGIITDLHLGWDDLATSNVDAALHDFHSLDLDLIVVLGDMADVREEHWRLVGEHIVRRITLPVIYVRGNADFQAGGDAAWSRSVPQPARYAMSTNGVRFVAVGGQSDTHVLPIGGDGIGFLRQDLAEHRDELGVVLCHAPIRNTTFWSCDNDTDGCLAGLLPPNNPPFRLQLRESEAMLDTLRESPNARLFLSGHVHNDHRMRCDHGYGPMKQIDGVAHIVTANLGGWVGIGVARKEGRVIHITPDEILVRVRNVIDRCYVPELDMRFPTRR